MRPRLPGWYPVAALLALAVGDAGAQVGAERAEQESAPATREEEGEPERTDLVERAAARLVQIDVTVNGPAEVIAGLTAEDFRVKLGFKRIRDFQLDRFCSPPPGAEEHRSGDRALGGTESWLAGGRPASFLFYFDQPHLTASGRHRSMQLARDLVAELIANGNRGMLVSNARTLKTYTELTDRAEDLLLAVDGLEDDREQWDFYAVEERQRIDEVITTLNRDRNLDLAIAKARGHQREERWRTERNLRRLESVLTRFAEIDPPKAVIYFADTLRRNAGEHYVGFFGNTMRSRDSNNPIIAKMETDATTSTIAFDRVVNEAAAQGIRFYAVLPEGLTAHLARVRPSASAVAITGQGDYGSRIGENHARATLASLSSETGGYAFLNGAPATVMVERIREDFSCLYLISFGPSGYLLDVPHRIVVEVQRSDVETRARGRVVLQSEETRLTSRLLGAFTAPGSTEEDAFEVEGVLVPTGFDDGRYIALVQVIVPGTPLAPAIWDLGASLVSRNKVQAETSGRLSLSTPGVPLVLESEVRLPPGPFELVAVAHETRTDLVVSARDRGDWVDPAGGPAAVGPIALMQPREGAFHREGESRRSGSLALAPGRPAWTDRPTALVALVCRGRSRGEGLFVERTLVGDSPADFPPVELEADEQRCAQIRDVIPADTLGPGAYRYEVRVVRDGAVLSRGAREFHAVDPPR